MRAPRAQRLLLACCVLAILAYSAAARSPGFLALAGVALAAAWAWGGAPRFRPPRPVLYLLLALAMAWGLGRALTLGLSVDVFCEFLTALLCVRVLDRGRPREDGQSLALAVFLAIGAMLTDVSVWVGLCLLALLPVLAAAALDHQIAAARARAVAPLARGPRAARDRGASIALATVLALAISAAVFVVLPRGLGARAFSRLGAGISGVQTGFTDEVRLGGGGGVISESPQPVLDAGIFDRSGVNLGSSARVLYLRGAVLDRYDGGLWKSGDANRPPLTQRLAADEWGRASDWMQTEAGYWDTELRVTMRDRSGAAPPAIFTIWEPTELRFTTRTEFTVNPASGALAVETPQDLAAYAVRSRSEQPVRGPLAEVLRPRGRPATFASAPVRELAERLLRELAIEPDPLLRPIADDFRAARAIEQHLRTRYAYTLENRPVPPGQDPIEWFLTDLATGQRGHCEYFAAAMAAMCRSVGVHARVITGYVATDFNALTGLYLVRRSNAHAWVEVQIEPGLLRSSGEQRSSGVWRTFDPTPPAEFRRIHEPRPGMLAAGRRLLEAIEYAWVRGVVSFDSQSRERILGDLAHPSWAEGLDERLERRVRSRPNTRQVLAAAALAVLAGLAVVAGGTAAIALGRRLRGDAASGGLADRVSWGGLWRPYRRAVRAVTVLDAASNSSGALPLRARARAARWPDPAARAEADRLIDALYRARFGSPSANARDAELDALSRRVLRSVR